MAGVPTAPVASGSLVAGFALARATGARAVGAVPLGLGGAWSAVQWQRRRGTPVAGALLCVYAAAFAGSHLLARRIGAWPSVVVVAAVTAGASWVLADRHH